MQIIYKFIFIFLIGFSALAESLPFQPNEAATKDIIMSEDLSLNDLKGNQSFYTWKLFRSLVVNMRTMPKNPDDPNDNGPAVIHKNLVKLEFKSSPDGFASGVRFNAEIEIEPFYGPACYRAILKLEGVILENEKGQMPVLLSYGLYPNPDLRPSEIGRFHLCI